MIEGALLASAAEGDDRVARSSPGLLPIMWSTRVGAEVMKPLATPVLGGMVSSLLHVLIVTPVIFFWLRERPARIAPRSRTCPERRSRRDTSARRAPGGISSLPPCSVAGISGADGRRHIDRTNDHSGGRERTTSNLTALVDRPLKQGRNVYTIEFRTPAGTLVDVGTSALQPICRCRAWSCQAAFTQRTNGPLRSHGGVRHGRRLADVTRVGRSCRPWLSQFRGDGAMTNDERTLLR